jgi:elongation factor G
MISGIVAGYQVIDVHVELLDGSSHDVDSNEQAFKMAAIFAMKDAFKNAGCHLLEPIMSVECTTPEQFQGDIMGDLNRRRGRIGEIDGRNNICIIKSEVPLAEMFGYSTDIRTLSSGRASYSMEPSHFEQVPPAIVAKLVEQRGGYGI